jgi:glycosyltransferase involved in cell wall biosynthesis
MARQTGVNVLSEMRSSEFSVSVLMAVYAGESAAHLEECLQSLCVQTHPFEELVLVEDGPLPAELSAVIDRYRSRLRVVSVRMPANVGLASALNEGLRHCQSELVARMDADDVCLPDRLAAQVDAFREDPSLSIVGGYAIEIDEHGIRGRTRRMPSSHERIVASLWACPLIHPTVMFRREAVVRLGGYDGSLRRRQDYELWFRCAANGLRFANVARPVLLYRFTSNALRKQPAGLAFQQALVGYRGASLIGLPLWKRLACFGPFFRSLLPARLQYFAYRLSGRLDPRQRVESG